MTNDECLKQIDLLTERIMNLETEVEHWRQEFKYINQCEKGLYGMRLERDALLQLVRAVDNDVLKKAIARLHSLPVGFTDWILDKPDFPGDEIIGPRT